MDKNNEIDNTVSVVIKKLSTIYGELGTTFESKNIVFDYQLVSIFLTFFKAKSGKRLQIAI